MKEWHTREICIGDVWVGGQNPIRIQSMTTSDTRDVEATTEQIMRLADVGCEIARVTVQGKKEAEAVEGIKNALLSKGYTIPLVADIHFYPPAAMLVADFADKIRINPGNFVDKRASFKQLTYDDESYQREIDKIEEKFTPLVEKCKRLGRAMRIGTNHGSLSDRIMNRFGDSPPGMVESALEFARIARNLDYHNFLFSMKSSNTKVMIAAYRLLVQRMMELGWDYPLHLGVTEAGEGEDGRVKSSIGIGSLLLQGIGDTIRVSLTEDPWDEIPPAKKIAALGRRPYFQPTIPERNLKRPFHPQGAALTEEDVSEDVLYYTPQDPPSDYAFFNRQLNPKPVILKGAYETLYETSTHIGGLLCDGLGEGVLITGEAPAEQREALGLAILQGARMRSSKTEYISCPGCGRTLFDLKEVSAKIRNSTVHLAGVKIAIMGCIVNGPGEMADADFGYVGSRPGMIDLYIGKTCVERNIPMENAEARLISLIKAEGKWIEP